MPLLGKFRADPGFILRRATGQDAAEIARLKVIIWRDSYVGLMPQESLDGLDAEAETQHWKSWLEDETAQLIALILEKDGKGIGYGLAGPMRKGDRPGKEIEARSEIYAIYIHPDHQRQGYGQQLFVALIQALIEAGYDDVGLWMIGGNSKAERFYEKLEGTETGKRVEIHNGRIAFREKGWRWADLRQLLARLTVRLV